MSGSPDQLQPYVGWRVWDLRWPLSDETPSLFSPFSGEAWPARQALMARCRGSFVDYGEDIWQGCALSPGDGCRCGLYASAEPESLAPLFLHLLASDRPAYVLGCRVIGAVSMWGRLVECEEGYRSQFGYPLELWLPEWQRLAGLRYALQPSPGMPEMKTMEAAECADLLRSTYGISVHLASRETIEALLWPSGKRNRYQYVTDPTLPR